MLADRVDAIAESWQAWEDMMLDDASLGKTREDVKLHQRAPTQVKARQCAQRWVNVRALRCDSICLGVP